MRPNTGPVGPTADAGPPPQTPPTEPGRRRSSRRLWAVVGGLGILGTIGGYVTTLALNTAHDRLTEPLKVDVRDTTSSPNDLFSTATSPQDAPIDASDPNGDAFRGWAAQQHGIPYQNVSQQLVLRGRDPQTVVVQEIRVRVVDRAPSPTDGWVNAWDGCGAALPVRLLNVDFGKEPPQVDLYVDGEKSNGTVFSITDTSVEVFDVDVWAGSDLASWVFEVRYSAAGRDGVVTVDDSGKPFRIAGGGHPSVFAASHDGNTLIEDDAQTVALAGGDALC
jgi:hypothetical protein